MFPHSSGDLCQGCTIPTFHLNLSGLCGYCSLVYHQALPRFWVHHLWNCFISTCRLLLGQALLPLHQEKAAQLLHLYSRAVSPPWLSITDVSLGFSILWVPILDKKKNVWFYNRNSSASSVLIQATSVYYLQSGIAVFWTRWFRELFPESVIHCACDPHTGLRSVPKLWPFPPGPLTRPAWALFLSDLSVLWCQY